MPRKGTNVLNFGQNEKKLNWQARYQDEASWNFPSTKLKLALHMPQQNLRRVRLPEYKIQEVSF